MSVYKQSQDGKREWESSLFETDEGDIPHCDGITNVQRFPCEIFTTGTLHGSDDVDSKILFQQSQCLMIVSR